MTLNKTHTLGCLVLLAAMTLGAQGAAAHTDATSKLLLPYFEVELSGTTATTIFSVTNASPDPVPVKISVYSNWGIEIQSASMTIDGHAVYTADLKAWIVNGKLPGKTLDAAEIAHCQAALSGQRSPQDDLYYSSELRPGYAVGYVIIQAKGHGAADEFLFGEYFVLDPSEDFAQGDFLVDLERPTACDHLCDRHGVRFLAGGGFDSGTEVVIWTGHPSFPRGPSASAYFDDEEKTAADALAYRQNGEAIDHMGLGFLPLEVVKVSELGLSAPFGWIDLLTDRPTLITLRLSASNRYSVGFQTSCLPLPPGDDPPGDDPESATLTLIKHVINDDGGVLQVADFPLFIDGQQVASGVAETLDPGTYTASEQNQPGYEAGTWGGDCAADGTVTLAAGDDKVCEITNNDTHIEVEPDTATLTLIKHVINDDGGTLQVADFPLFISGQQVTSGVAATLDPGTYTASEQNQPGYTAGTWGGDCAANGTVSLAAGEHKVCEITNNDDPLPPPPPPPPADDEGCTPGYWKNHTDSWPPTGYSPGQSVASVFGAASAYPAIASASLLDALGFRGGSDLEGAAGNLMRAAVAALLDASHPDVNYPRTPGSVISSADSALASGDRDTMLSVASSLDQDNNLGCPLN